MAGLNSTRMFQNAECRKYCCKIFSLRFQPIGKLTVDYLVTHPSPGVEMDFSESLRNHWWALILTRWSILGSDSMTKKSDCSFSLVALWVLFILKSLSHPEVVLISAWRIWGWKIKIESNKQTYNGRTNGDCDFLSSCWSQKISWHNDDHDPGPMTGRDWMSATGAWATHTPGAISKISA